MFAAGRILTLPPTDDSVSLSSFGGEGRGEEAVTPGGKRLKLEHIGPAPTIEVEEFGERLNLVTGDNGLGKTFLLDACWYALTRTWADGKQFYPLPEAPKQPTPLIGYSIIGKNGQESRNTAEYQFRDQSWVRKQARPPMPGLVIYARIGGGFSVWDPARNYWRPENETDDGKERPAAFQFSVAD